MDILGGEAVGSYLESCRKLNGRPRGPIHQAVQLCEKLGINVRQGHLLEVDGDWVPAREVTGWQERVEQAAQDYQWKGLAQGRYNFDGLQAGRDRQGDAWGKKLRFLAKRQWSMVQADGVFTPWRAHQRDQARPECPACGHAAADWKRLRWECTEVTEGCSRSFRGLLQAYSQYGGQPRCLWLLGIVPNGWLPDTSSRDMQEREDWQSTIRPGERETMWVFTDGGCVRPRRAEHVQDMAFTAPALRGEVP